MELNAHNQLADLYLLKKQLECFIFRANVLTDNHSG
jgi:hypothetical protein